MCRADMDDGRPDVYRETEVKAAGKQHRCRECYRTIEPGEPYTSAFVVLDGHASTERTCQHCKVGARWLIDTCSGYVFGEVCEELHEHAQEYAGTNVAMPLARVVVGMRRKWKTFRGDGLMPAPQMPPPIDVGAANG